MSDETTVRTLLAGAGITPTTEWDMAALVAAYAVLRPAADLLYAVPEARYESPATRFDPAPVLADWDQR
jgi:hypothetical protein